VNVVVAETHDGLDEGGEAPVEDAGESDVSCAPGTADCNGNPGDGCETDTTADASNCGWCGHDCLGSSCASGACQPIVVATPIGTGTTLHNGFFALGPTSIYFAWANNPTGPGGVGMAAKDGSGPTCIACNTGNPRLLATDATSVYWCDNGINEVRKAPLTGSPVSTLWSGSVGTPIAVDAGHVYWFNSGASAVMQSDLTGGGARQIATGQPNVSSLATAGSFLFWTTNADLVQLELASSTQTTLASAMTSPQSVVIDATHAYWVTGGWTGTETVQRIPRAGGAVEPLTSEGASRIALDATHIYAADGHDGVVWRMPKSGGAVERLAAGQPSPWDIAVDAVAVYWSSEANGSISRLAK
jgi:hypothetical protein